MEQAQDPPDPPVQALVMPSLALQAMRVIAEGYAPESTLEKSYAVLFKDDFKEFSRQLHGAEERYRAEVDRAKKAEAEGAKDPSAEAPPDAGNDKIEDLIQQIIKEATS